MPGRRGFLCANGRMRGFYVPMAGSGGFYVPMAGSGSFICEYPVKEAIGDYYMRRISKYLCDMDLGL